MMPPHLPANDTHRPTATRPICVPPRPRTGTPAPKESSAPTQVLVSKTSTPPPAPRRLVAKPSKPAPPPLPSKTPPPLPQPAQLADADLIDDEETVLAPRNPLPSSEDVDLDCFTLSEPPPESRPQRKRAWLAGITGLVLVTMTGVLLMARPVTNGAIRLLNTNGGAARAPAMLAVAPPSTPSAVTTPRKDADPRASAVDAGARAKLSTHGKSTQAKAIRAKKPLKRAAPKRVLLK